MSNILLYIYTEIHMDTTHSESSPVTISDLKTKQLHNCVTAAEKQQVLGNLAVV